MYKIIYFEDSHYFKNIKLFESCILWPTLAQNIRFMDVFVLINYNT